MYEIVNKKRVDQIDLCSINDKLCHNRIVLAQKTSDPTTQSILVHSGSKEWQWCNFYCMPPKRTIYETAREAIESRYEKGYRIFMLDNKTELKEAIKHK